MKLIVTKKDANGKVFEEIVTGVETFKVMNEPKPSESVECLRKIFSGNKFIDDVYCEFRSDDGSIHDVRDLFKDLLLTDITKFGVIKIKTDVVINVLKFSMFIDKLYKKFPIFEKRNFSVDINASYDEILDIFVISACRLKFTTALLPMLRNINQKHLLNESDFNRKCSTIDAEICDSCIISSSADGFIDMMSFLTGPELFDNHMPNLNKLPDKFDVKYNFPKPDAKFAVGRVVKPSIVYKETLLRLNPKDFDEYVPTALHLTIDRWIHMFTTRKDKVFFNNMKSVCNDQIRIMLGIFVLFNIMTFRALYENELKFVIFDGWNYYLLTRDNILCDLPNTINSLRDEISNMEDVTNYYI